MTGIWKVPLAIPVVPLPMRTKRLGPTLGGVPVMVVETTSGIAVAVGVAGGEELADLGGDEDGSVEGTVAFAGGEIEVRQLSYRRRQC